MSLIANKIRKKEIEPKLYSLLLEGTERGELHLRSVVAYSLDEAVDKAEEEIEGTGKKSNGVLLLRCIKPVKDIIFESCDLDVNEFLQLASVEKKRLPKTSLLMQRVLDKNDKDFYEKRKNKFTEEQRRYIEERAGW